MMRGLWYWWCDYWLLVVAVLLPVVFMVVGVLVSLEKEKQWQQFKEAHACRLVGVVASQAIPGIGVGFNASGNSTVVSTTQFIPEKEGWLCADGITYWR